MKAKITPSDAYAIVDKDGRLIEKTGTGELAVFYSMEDAAVALPPIQRTFKHAQIVPVTIHKAT